MWVTCKRERRLPKRRPPRLGWKGGGSATSGQNPLKGAALVGGWARPCALIEASTLYYNRREPKLALYFSGSETRGHASGCAGISGPQITDRGGISQLEDEPPLLGEHPSWGIQRCTQTSSVTSIGSVTCPQRKPPGALVRLQDEHLYFGLLVRVPELCSQQMFVESLLFANQGGPSSGNVTGPKAGRAVFYRLCWF